MLFHLILLNTLPNLWKGDNKVRDTIFFCMIWRNCFDCNKIIIFCGIELITYKWFSKQNTNAQIGETRNSFDFGLKWGLFSPRSLWCRRQKMLLRTYEGRQNAEYMKDEDILEAAKFTWLSDEQDSVKNVRCFSVKIAILLFLRNWNLTGLFIFILL